MDRYHNREAFDANTRLRLIESDLDAVDLRFDHYGLELERTNERLSKILWTLVGLLVSVSTACVLFALNLAVPK